MTDKKTSEPVVTEPSEEGVDAQLSAQEGAEGPDTLESTDEPSTRAEDNGARGTLARGRAWLHTVLHRGAFDRPDLTPPTGTIASASSHRVEASGEDEVDDWEDEWEQPATTEDPWTPPTVTRAVWLRLEPDRVRTWLGMLGVLLFACALYLPFIDAFGLWDPWETHYGEVSRHMTETNDWISPWWGSHWHRPDAAAEGKSFFSKPILGLWSMALGLDTWGWNEFSIRIGIALMAILAVVFAYMTGASVWNRRTGFLMALVMSTSPFFFFLSRQTQADMPFVSMLAVAMSLFMMAAFGKDRRKPADVVHYVLLFGTLAALVFPQLWVIGTDVGFDETQRAMRPGLRAQSMNDFKGAQVYEEVVMAHSPKLSPVDRRELAEMSQEDADARIEGSRSSIPDFALELTGPAFAVGIGLFLVFMLFFWGLRGTLKARLLDTERNRVTVWGVVILALLSQALAMVLHIKRLYDGFGMNWEGELGASFNLVKFSGLAMTLVLLLLTGGFIWAWRQDRRGQGAGIFRRLPWILTIVFTLVMVISPLLLVMKAKALGLDGLSFWEVETFSVGRSIKVILGSIYAPIVLGLFLVISGVLWLSARARFWHKRNADVLWSLLILVASLIFLCVSVFYIPITLQGQLSTFGKVAGKLIGAVFQWGPVQVLLYLLILAVIAVSLYTSKRKTVGQVTFLGFYIFAALATLAKGLLGIALPGAIIFFYLIVTVEWKRLAEFEVPRGLLAFTAVGVPWYAAMLILHENAYFQRFFVHDHFKRLASGVHQIDSGTFEHFIHWLGYGLFPWAALVPAVMIRLGAGRGLLLRDDRSRTTLMLAIWATFAFALFSLSSTKFHHYIFPVVPPLALLVALLVAELWQGKVKRFMPVAVSAVVFVVLIGWDVYEDPQLWKNLFTYKYDRGWIDKVPEFTAYIFGEATLVRGADLHRTFQMSAGIATIGAAAGFGMLFFAKRAVRMAGIILVGVVAVWFTIWGVQVYMPGISPTWSQRGVWMSYWDSCTRIDAPANADPKKIWCEESALVYRITWRGEHYYSQNEAIPIQNDDDLKYFAKVNGETPFYFMTDRSRYCLGSAKSPNFGVECKGTGSIVSEVKKHYPGKKIDHKLMWDENMKFVMIKFWPGGNPEYKADEAGLKAKASRETPTKTAVSKTVPKTRKPPSVVPRKVPKKKGETTPRTLPAAQKTAPKTPAPAPVEGAETRAPKKGDGTPARAPKKASGTSAPKTAPAAPAVPETAPAAAPAGR